MAKNQVIEKLNNFRLQIKTITFGNIRIENMNSSVMISNDLTMILCYFSKYNFDYLRTISMNYSNHYSV